MGYVGTSCPLALALNMPRQQIGGELKLRGETQARDGQEALESSPLATAAALGAHPHITQDPRVCSGRHCIAGTRVRVLDVVSANAAGVSVEALQDYFATRRLTMSELYAALAYYHDHKDEIDAASAEDERLSESVEAQMHAARQAR